MGRNKRKKKASRNQSKAKQNRQIHGNQSNGLRGELKAAIESSDTLREKIARKLGMKPTELFRLATGPVPIGNDQRSIIKAELNNTGKMG